MIIDCDELCAERMITICRLVSSPGLFAGMAIKPSHCRRQQEHYCCWH